MATAEPAPRPPRTAATTMPVELSFLGVPVRRVERCASTMDLIAELAKSGAPTGTGVLAGEQTAGRGRAGRVWTAPPGSSILFSALLRPDVPPARLSQLSILLAVCVARVVTIRTGRAVRIKWPNDVLVDGAKVSGVLANARFPNGGAPEVIVGIGLNVNIPPDQLPEGATSLRSLTGHEHDLDAVFAHLLRGLEILAGAFRRGNVRPWLLEAATRLAFVGEHASIQEGGRELTGTVLGLAPSGALRLRDDDGEVHDIWSGDLVRGPRPLRTRTDRA